MHMPASLATQPETGLRRLPDEYYLKFLSDIAKNRKPNPIRSLYPLEKKPGVISLLAGKPNPASFPFSSISFTSRSPTSGLENTGEAKTTLTIDGDDLAVALQYGDTSGWKKLIDWLHGLQEFNHGRKKDDGWRVSAGTGSQDLLYKAFSSIFNPGDPVFIETPTYSGAIATLQTLQCSQIEVETDSHGVIPSSLRTILEQWPEGKPKPKAFYTIPCGGNPTGATIPADRKREILRLAREYDFLILEDDPYYYLYYSDEPRPPSYFSLEQELPEVGRVLRFDSISKIVSAGLRMGFVTGPGPLLQAIDLYTATANLQSSSLTQVVVFKLFDSWGYEGFRMHCETVSAFYRAKRDIFETAMKKHLSGLVEWSSPESGLFFWFKLLLPDGGDSESIIKTRAYEYGVLALPGTVFLPSGKKTAYARAAFSLLSEEDVEEALKRLRQVIIQETRGSDVPEPE